jgi:hypothetical protein
LTNSHAPRIGEEGYRSFIPFVEVWYPEAIPLSAVDSYIITWWNSNPGEIGIREFRADRLREFEEIVSWVQETLLKRDQIKELNKD